VSDGIESLAAAVGANLGVAVVVESTRVFRDNGRDFAVLEMEQQPEAIRVSVGVLARHSPPPHVLAFIEELKLAAWEEKKKRPVAGSQAGVWAGENP